MIKHNMSTLKNEISDLMMDVFSNDFPDKNKEWFLNQVVDSDFEQSIGYFIDNKLVAVYIISIENEPFNIINGKGIRGNVLAVLPTFRNQGIAKLLLKTIQRKFKDYDYLWGTQATQLNNTFWNKYRTAFASDKKRRYTICWLKQLKLT